MFSYVQPALQIKNYSISTSVIKIAIMRSILMISMTQRKSSGTTTKSTLFVVSKDKWKAKEDTGKSMKNALYILRHAKRYLSG